MPASKLKSKDAAGEDETSYGAGSMTTTATKSANGGIDIAARQEFDGFTETKSLRIPDSNVPVRRHDEGGVALGGIDRRGGAGTKSFLDLLAFGIGNADFEKVKAEPGGTEIAVACGACRFGTKSAEAMLFPTCEVTSPVGILRARQDSTVCSPQTASGKTASSAMAFRSPIWRSCRSFCPAGLQL